VTRTDAYLLLGVVLAGLGTARLLLTADLIRRVIALNVASAGVLMLLVALAYRADPAEPDPVLHALVLTGIVITVSVTALALGLVRRIETAQAEEQSGEARRGAGDPHPDAAGDAPTSTTRTAVPRDGPP
jgi:multicomponent Na+:H+ antiporter subunit C